MQNFNLFVSAVLFIIINLMTINTWGQYEDPVPSKYVLPQEKVYVIAEQEPSFPGGMDSLAVFINNELNYPSVSSDNVIQGTVYVRFVVNVDGSIEQVELVRGIHESFDKEAIRVAKVMPNWIPGEINGKAVRVWFTLPIRFK